MYHNKSAAKMKPGESQNTSSAMPMNDVSASKLIREVKVFDNEEIFRLKVESATLDLPDSVHRPLTEKMSTENAMMLAEHIIQLQRERNISLNTRKAYIKCISRLDSKINHKPFSQVTNQDLIMYFVLRIEDRRMAKNGLILGIILTVAGIVISTIANMAVLSTLSQ